MEVEKIGGFVARVGGFCGGWYWWWEVGAGGEGAGENGVGFEIEEGLERGGGEPGWRGDVCAFLAFEEEGEPEWELGWKWGVEAFCRALEREGRELRGIYAFVIERLLCRGLGRFSLTPSSSSPSSLWRGITVTSSISQRKPTSLGVRPGGSGRAIVCLGAYLYPEQRSSTGRWR